MSVLSFARIRPPALSLPGQLTPATTGGKLSFGGKSYQLDGVLGQDATQEAAFDATARAAAEGLFEGYSGAAIAYGASGTGKTWAVLGGPGSAEHGLAPRAARLVLERVAAEAGGGSSSEFALSVSYCEVHRESVRDLLRPGAARGSLPVREAPGRGCYADGLSSVYATTLADVLDTLAVGESARAAPGHGRERGSALLTLTLRQTAPDESVTLARLTFADLASSECLQLRAAPSDSDGLSETDVELLQRPLAALADAAKALADGKAPNLRQSKLTRLLGGALGGDCRDVSWISTITPAAAAKRESLAALQLAALARGAAVRAVPCAHRAPALLEDALGSLRVDLRDMKTYTAKLESQLASAGLQVGGIAAGGSKFSLKFGRGKKKASASAEQAQTSALDPAAVQLMRCECERLACQAEEAQLEAAGARAAAAAASASERRALGQLEAAQAARAADHRLLLLASAELRKLAGGQAATPGDGAEPEDANAEILRLAEARCGELETESHRLKLDLTGTRAREVQLRTRLELRANIVQRPATFFSAAEESGGAAAEAAKSQAQLAHEDWVASQANTTIEATSGAFSLDMLDEQLAEVIADAGSTSTFAATPVAPPPAAAAAPTRRGAAPSKPDPDAELRREQLLSAARIEIEASRSVLPTEPLPFEWKGALEAEPLVFGTIAALVCADPNAGVPASVRAHLWMTCSKCCPPPCTPEQYCELACAEQSKEAASGWRDESALAIVDASFEEDARCDLPNRQLHRLLRAYVQIDDGVQPNEAMILVASVAVKVLPEYEAFCMFCALLQGQGWHEFSDTGRPGLGLRGLFVDTAPLLRLLDAQFSAMVRRQTGAVALHFEKRNTRLAALCGPWLATLFASAFPMRVALRIWDSLVLQLVPRSVWSEPGEKTGNACDVLVLASVACVKLHRDELLSWNIASAMDLQTNIGLSLADKEVAQQFFSENFYLLVANAKLSQELKATRLEFEKTEARRCAQNQAPAGSAAAGAAPSPVVLAAVDASTGATTGSAFGFIDAPRSAPPVSPAAAPGSKRALLEEKLQLWLGDIPIGGKAQRGFDPQALVRFALSWNLADATAEEIYAKYVERQVEDAEVWVTEPAVPNARGPEGKTRSRMQTVESLLQ